MPAVNYPTTTLVLSERDEVESINQIVSQVASLYNTVMTPDEAVYHLRNHIAKATVLRIPNAHDRNGNADWSFDFYGTLQSFRIRKNTNHVELHFHGGESIMFLFPFAGVQDDKDTNYLVQR